jgi:small redox-active disulfide protein 2
MKIEVLVIGCAKCKRLERNVEQALKELGLDIEVITITDIEEMKKRGVMRVPVLFIDGEVKSVASAPGVEEIKAMIMAAMKV